MYKRTEQRTLFISHGGGPLPLMGDKSHQEMIDLLLSIRSELPKPSVILLISAHWEQQQPTITGNEHPDLLYDYAGFPEETYSIEYPAPGEPRLAQEIYSLLKKQGFNPAIDNSRGFDHGMFIPLKIMYPEADIPCVQLSLVNSLDPSLHIDIGESLADIQQDGLLVIGSGFSFHNMPAFFSPASVQEEAMNNAFEEWLIETCTTREIEESARRNSLVNWQKAPHARYCHPREEHLLPLHVCYGMNNCASSKFYPLKILGKSASFYLW